MSASQDGVAGTNSPAPGSPSGEWSDEQHHVAPEGAQRPMLLDLIDALDEWEQMNELSPYEIGVVRCLQDVVMFKMRERDEWPEGPTHPTAILRNPLTLQSLSPNHDGSRTVIITARGTEAQVSSLITWMVAP